uniref:uncharacterized protein LOC122608771 n=1 Tax=Erigeron canadensis TaxID=72917 RepID=UPI001CB9CB19|nr:uncharacterized protein LOC122608771 [Erigeron canadensis]
MCKEDIYSFHLCYYECERCEDYSLHKFCAELPLTLKNHHLHPAHDLTFVDRWWLTTYKRNGCGVCKDNSTHDDGRFIVYNCSICEFYMDINCATLSQQKMVHPSHPDHQLERMMGTMISKCHACDNEHKGTFYHCPTCVWFGRIHLDCALLPAKLSIQQVTDDAFTHPHPLTLAYSFPLVDYAKQHYPRCRVCSSYFNYFSWLYKCDKCRYYAHVDCATSKKEPFMSIFWKQANNKENDGDEMINHFGHQHPLVLFNTTTTETSLIISKSVSLLLHNPMERIQLLCDGCVRPITTVPFYKCCLQQQENNNCSFVLHTWCATMLPSEIRDHPGHLQHSSVLALVTRRIIPANIFHCGICELPCNGFSYRCCTANCDFRVDINCAFIPQEITHEAHPNHLLSLVKFPIGYGDYQCVGCTYLLRRNQLMYHCPSCNFYLHSKCALLLPKIVRHKYADRHHPLTLRYEPVENHPSKYFCDICETEFNSLRWFYHCSTTCDASMHSACAPVILQCEKAVYSLYQNSVFEFLNVKFGGSFKTGHHPHRFTFDQGISDDGGCKVCGCRLQYKMIFKCFECKFAFHHDWCASIYARRRAGI